MWIDIRRGCVIWIAWMLIGVMGDSGMGHGGAGSVKGRHARVVDGIWSPSRWGMFSSGEGVSSVRKNARPWKPTIRFSSPLRAWGTSDTRGGVLETSGSSAGDPSLSRISSGRGLGTGLGEGLGGGLGGELGRGLRVTLRRNVVDDRGEAIRVRSGQKDSEMDIGKVPPNLSNHNHDPTGMKTNHRPDKLTPKSSNPTEVHTEACSDEFTQRLSGIGVGESGEASAASGVADERFDRIVRCINQHDMQKHPGDGAVPSKYASYVNYVFCDNCNHKDIHNHPHFFHCPKCNYDLCTSCAQKQPFGRVGSRLTWRRRPVQDMFTHDRKERLRSAIKCRQKGVIVVLENISNYENAAAIVRSCDAFGVGSVWFVRRKANDGLERALMSDTFTTISTGAVRWINTRIFESTTECMNELKSMGYTSFATCLEPRSVSVYETRMDNANIALWMGNEAKGLTVEAINGADHCVVLPMRGMVQSLNLSTAGAIFLAEIMRQRYQALKKDPTLQQHYDWTPEEQDGILDDILVQELLRKHQKSIFNQPNSNSNSNRNTAPVKSKKDYWEKRVFQR